MPVEVVWKKEVFSNSVTDIFFYITIEKKVFILNKAILHLK